jgi:large subunit ribosomal protein L10
MPTRKKEEIVKKLAELTLKCTIVIIADYQGISAVEMTRLRRRLRESGIEYHVVKNTLARLAAERASREGLESLLYGPSAIVFGYGEITEPAKVLVDYIRLSKSALRLKGGLLDNRVLSFEEIVELTTLPPKQALISKLMQEMQTPISALITVLDANLKGLIGVLQARKQQLGGG